MTATSTSRSRFRAVLAQRCPRCLEGKVFASVWRMHEDCPHCGTHFEREPGYFIGAMYFGYFVGLLTLVPLVILTFVFDWNAWIAALIAELQIIALLPFLFRYSRVIWLHMDELIDPRSER